MKHQKLLDDTWQALEADANEKNGRRTYMGMSGIVSNCDRKTWLEFRHGFTSHIDYKSATFFADGHYSEIVMTDRIKLAGYNLKTEEADGNQIAVQDYYWLRGHTDGEIVIVDEKYVYEHKCTNPAKLTKLKKLIDKNEHKALKQWDKQYYSQAQLYMHYTGIHKHVLTAAGEGSREKLNKDGDFRTAIVETLYNEKDAVEYKQKGLHLITTSEMPPASPSLEYDKPLCIWAN